MKFTKKVIWDFGDNSDKEAFDNEGQIDFWCGVENSDGTLDEMNDYQTPVLEDIFNDHEVDIGAAECYHIIKPNTGESYDTLKKVVNSRIITAGGIKQKFT